jgi:hypothetical protein
MQPEDLGFWGQVGVGIAAIFAGLGAAIGIKKKMPDKKGDDVAILHNVIADHSIRLTVLETRQANIIEQAAQHQAETREICTRIFDRLDKISDQISDQRGSRA